MKTLEQAERRFDDLLGKLEAEITSASKARTEAGRAIELVDKIEKRTETSIRQLRDLIRQGDGESHG